MGPAGVIYVPGTSDLTSLDGREGRPPSPSLPFLTQQVYTSWNGLLSSTSLSHRPGPLTPLFSNADFSPTASFDTFLIWKRRDKIRLVQTLSGAHKLLPYDTLKDLCPGVHLSWLAYWQMKSFLPDSTFREALSQNRTPFKDYLLLTSVPSHMLSSIYAFIRDSSKSPPLPFVQAWEAGVHFSEQEWQKAFILAHKLMMACFAQENAPRNWKKGPVLWRIWHAQNSSNCTEIWIWGIHYVWKNTSINRTRPAIQSGIFSK